ncbi:TetR/AcrR family transcriptional regulator [Nocardia yunnanensis]|uniref:TetR/AcrR family transcriptional regulator n=1 Tax=Nocardia yunnanensis TaxID=2382165 RepID=A0A386ZKV5_9NOCA|nr:TetR/AcrR family transcriptional regulator [Nocardia yunnanensis]AYF78086.1 TetR/AcrR family transcriptional regulator [Nocardia yunnanensis]
MSPADSAPDRRTSYHHGALRTALIDAGIALASEGGPDRVVLREAARAAGVSHSAAYRHFADREALLAEVSRHARAELAAEMRRRLSRVRDPRARLHAVGTSYIDFALTRTGLFRTAFGAAAAPGDGAADDPHRILGQVLDEALAAGLLDPEVRPGAETAAWSAVHGLSTLLLSGALPTTRPDIDAAVSQVLGLINRGLLSTFSQR